MVRKKKKEIKENVSLNYRNNIHRVSQVRGQFQFDELHSLTNAEEVVRWQQGEFYCLKEKKEVEIWSHNFNKTRTY